MAGHFFLRFGLDVPSVGLDRHRDSPERMKPPNRFTGAHAGRSSPVSGIKLANGPA